MSPLLNGEGLALVRGGRLLFEGLDIELKDGEAHQFADLGANQATYLYRALEAAAAADVATSITSAGTLTVWVNGEKVLWEPGAGTIAALRPSITLLPGDNRIVVAALDDQGIRWRRSFGIRGEIVQSAAVDAVDAGGFE